MIDGEKSLPMKKKKKESTPKTTISVLENYFVLFLFNDININNMSN